MTNIERQFVRLDEGLVHLRTAGERTELNPLLMLHASPACSRSLEPLIQHLAGSRYVIAPDTLGCGDSVAPAGESPNLEYYANSMSRLLDAMNVDSVDVYGTHTGSHIGIELALAESERVQSLTMDGVALLSPEDQEDFLENYAPHKMADEYGGQFNWAWHYIRDQMVFFPHYRKDEKHKRVGGSFETEYLHVLTLDLLKNIEHYHKTYEAVFRHQVLERIKDVKQKILLLTDTEDVLAGAVPALKAANPTIEVRVVEEGHDQAAEFINAISEE
jgi:Predicted hydrolases or acyltransferases (alpha/beta hydrolase superfamily)